MSEATQHIGIEALEIVTLVVDDQEEAKQFYTETLGFEERMDDSFEMDGEEGRWLTVGVPGQDLQIALVTPYDPYYDEVTRERLEEKRGTETWWTFGTDDCAAGVEALRDAGVAITREPMEYAWGTEAMFADPFGNEFSLFEVAGT